MMELSETSASRGTDCAAGTIYPLSSRLSDTGQSKWNIRSMVNIPYILRKEIFHWRKGPHHHSTLYSSRIQFGAPRIGRRRLQLLQSSTLVNMNLQTSTVVALP